VNIIKTGMANAGYFNLFVNKTNPRPDIAESKDSFARVSFGKQIMTVDVARELAKDAVVKLANKYLLDVKNSEAKKIYSIEFFATRSARKPIAVINNEKHPPEMQINISDDKSLTFYLGAAFDILKFATTYKFDQIENLDEIQEKEKQDNIKIETFQKVVKLLDEDKISKVIVYKTNGKKDIHQFNI